MKTTLPPLLGLLLLAISVTSVPLLAAETGWDAKTFPTWPSPVNPKAIQIDGTTDIYWMPEPYQFVAGKSVRYIDFIKGDDNAAGNTKESAWKHHPWDANATGKAASESGVHTYIFKGGVNYRGQLIGKESGTAEEPIRLTRDPSWGEGPATLAGSEVIYGGWRKLIGSEVETAGLGKEAAGKVWSINIGKDFVPHALWATDGAGKKLRQTLARWPNWKIDHPYNHFTQWFTVKKIKEGFPRTVIFADELKGFDKNAFDGATIWVDHPNSSSEFTIMGPVSSSVGGYDPEQGSLRPELNHPRRHPAVKSPFFLENKGWFLDEAGEWYYDKKSGDLFLWVTADADPNQLMIEVAHHPITLELQGSKHVEIAGLTFTGGNSIDPNQAVDVGEYKAPEWFAEMPAIRLLGDCRSISMHHLTITETAGGGIANLVTSKDDIVSDISITDSLFTFLDNDGISLFRGFSWRMAEAQPKARLTNVRIYRNYLYDIGRRGMSQSSAGKAIDLNGPEVADVAGNVIQWVAAHGININGGRPTAGFMGGNAAETPLIRIQVRQNKVKEALLYKTDFGNIEFWQTGPVYIYNNVSINPIGYIASRGQYHKNEAFYFDHGLKGYLFNNIGWTDERDDAYKGMIGTSFYKDVRTHWNILFSNTSLNFRTHYAHEGAAGDQQQIIGNMMINTVSFLSYWRLEEASEIAITRNLAAGRYENFYNRWRGETYRTIGGLQDSLSGAGNLIAKDIGWVTDEMPVINAKARDFRPTANSPAIDRGATVFVPWSLYGTVGEWYFRLQPRSPGEVLSYDLYPQEFYSDFKMMQLGGEMPDNRLEGEGFTAADYVPGVLENWTDASALRFDGTKTLQLPNARLVKDFTFKGRSKPTEVKGTDRRTVRMTDNNFLIEAVLQRDEGNAATLVAKIDDAAGYSLALSAEGQPVLTLKGGGQSVTYTGTQPLTADVWHHLVAEVDRAAGTATFYLDGKPDPAIAAGTALAAGTSIDTGADFIVGQKFVGALDFLRVSRGTLADAETTIEELMSWQFNGPHLHDITGRAPVGERRDIGAIEHPTATGQKEIVYVAPEETAKPKEKSDDGDTFLTGPDRTVTKTDWGTISSPKQASPGSKAEVQVAFATESIPNEMVMKMDLHGFVNGQRKTGLGQAAPIKVKPTVTTPYSATLTIPKMDGLTQVNVVIYVSPDGGFQNKLFGASPSIAVVEGGAVPAVSAKPKQSDVVPAPPSGVNIQKVELPWATIYLPNAGKVGEKINVRVDLNEGVVKSPTKLHVDTHWFNGGERNTGGGRIQPIPLEPEGKRSFEVTVSVPDKPGISAVRYVTYLTPDGTWKSKTNVTEVGFTVEP